MGCSSSSNASEPGGARDDELDRDVPRVGGTVRKNREEDLDDDAFEPEADDAGAGE